MIKSIAGKYRDVISMTPINRLNADKLVKIWNNVIKAVTEVGFDVVVTRVDGMRTNVSFYNKLAVPSSRSTNQLYVPICAFKINISYFRPCSSLQELL